MRPTRCQEAKTCQTPLIEKRPLMFKARLFRLSLRQVLTIPYVVLVLGLALTIVVLSYTAGSRAVDTVSAHLLSETVDRIGQAVDRHVMGSGAVLEAAFPDGMPVSPNIEKEVESLRTRFWIATSLHTDPNNYVYYGNRLGQAMGLFRHSSTEGELRLKLAAPDLRTISRFTGIHGELKFQSLEKKLFDPRLRPWYRAGENQNMPTWTSVYIDFGTEDLVATRARRVLGPDGELEGVVATDVSLRALNDFVTKLRVSEHGIAFIFEPNGDLIASSASPNVATGTDGSKARVNAVHSANPLIGAIYAQIQALQQDGESHPGGQSFNFTAPDGQVIHAAFDNITDDTGLKWCTVVAMPRSDFMAGVTSNLVRTALLSALAAVVAILIGLRVLSWVTGDLKRLSEAALQVGEGQLDWPVSVKRPDEIGQLAQSFQTMQRRLQTDSLTGLANREAFMLRLRQKIGQASASPQPSRFAVLFIDLNRFKQINDRFGHDVGDQVLIEIAERLRAMVRSRDLVARLSGDEFVVLLDQVDTQHSLDRVREAIELALKSPLAVLGSEAMLSADFGGSVGEALYPDDGEDAESLLTKADRRMYGQKFADRPLESAHPLRRASDLRG
jgi:diguanylate cyclase (GGDEF)-like protein